jgi:hypothetical protein
MLNVTIKMILKISGEKNRYNFPKGLRLEKTIQFFNLLLLSKAKIGGESKSKSRYHIDCKKNKTTEKIISKSKESALKRLILCLYHNYDTYT